MKFGGGNFKESDDCPAYHEAQALEDSDSEEMFPKEHKSSGLTIKPGAGPVPDLLAKHKRHVIPPELRRILFDMLDNLPEPPMETLTDEKIREAGRTFQDWDDNFDELRKLTTEAREKKGDPLKSEVESFKEARRILKSSWRASHRHV